MELPRTFAARLRIARQAQHLTQEELGRRVGLSGHIIGRLERGQTTVLQVESLVHLARILEVATDWLFAMDVEATDEMDEALYSPHV